MQDLTGQVRKSEAHYFAYGGLADIWKGIWRRDASEEVEVVIKVVRASWAEPRKLERLRKRLLREGKVWSKLKHPHVAPFYGVSFDADHPQSPCLISPYCANGDLNTYLAKNPNADAVAMLAQAASGISYLHNYKPYAIVHGDIKASNILVNNQNQATLSDFGVSRIIESSGVTSKSFCGTCRWMAYELVAPGNDDDYTPPLTTASDVWAFGMTILEVLTGKIPFAHIKNDATVILMIMRGIVPQVPENFDPGMWRLLQHCWALRPNQRPSIKTIASILDCMRFKKLSPTYVDSIVGSTPAGCIEMY